MKKCKNCHKLGNRSHECPIQWSDLTEREKFIFELLPYGYVPEYEDARLISEELERYDADHPNDVG